MKLGIVVVYMFSQAQEPLFDLHLRQIEKYTDVPYLIYCSVNRLPPEYRQRFAEHSQMLSFELPATELRGMHEHSYYLDRLIKKAIDDDATHIAVLHLDSFPIRARWIEELAGRLTTDCALATVEHINTACLVFRRDFYLSCKPTMLVPESVEATPAYKEYVQAWNPEHHSGIGYGFAAFSNGFSVYYLPRTGRHPNYASIYGDMFFHLVGTMRLQSKSPLDGTVNITRLSRGLLRSSPLYRLITPSRMRRHLRETFAPGFSRLIDQPGQAIRRRRNVAAMQELLQSPDAFIDDLRRQS